VQGRDLNHARRALASLAIGSKSLTEHVSERTESVKKPAQRGFESEKRERQRAFRVVQTPAEHYSER